MKAPPWRLAGVELASKQTIDGLVRNQGARDRLRKGVETSVCRGAFSVPLIRLIELVQMNEAGLREVERAKRDGRWDGAYDSPSGATIPANFQAVLNNTPRAKAFFATLDSRNRYAVLFR